MSKNPTLSIAAGAAPMTIADACFYLLLEPPTRARLAEWFCAEFAGPADGQPYNAVNAELLAQTPAEVAVATVGWIFPEGSPLQQLAMDVLSTAARCGLAELSDAGRLSGDSDES